MRNSPGVCAEVFQHLIEQKAETARSPDFGMAVCLRDQEVCDFFSQVIVEGVPVGRRIDAELRIGILKCMEYQGSDRKTDAKEASRIFEFTDISPGRLQNVAVSDGAGDAIYGKNCRAVDDIEKSQMAGSLLKVRLFPDEFDLIIFLNCVFQCFTSLIKI